MARFCTKCGKALEEGQKCSCSQNSGIGLSRSRAKSFVVKLLCRMGIGAASENSLSVFESGQQIVPDIIKPNDGETPVKQYDVAVMRSRIRGQYAKGRIQVTNKRVIFRAAGMSYQGPIAQQYEFSINEIAGVEIKKKNRISAMNVALCVLVNLLSILLGVSLFEDIANRFPILSLAAAIVFAALCTIPFFVLRQKFWLKFFLLNCGIGALAANASGIAPFLLGILYFLWLANVILVAVVSDLVLVVKTKGASPAFEIRRKQFPTMYKPMVEYTDFSEVLPGKDVDLMIEELGALIDDIQTLGDMAIDKWKEK